MITTRYNGKRFNFTTVQALKAWLQTIALFCVAGLWGTLELFIEGWL